MKRLQRVETPDYVLWVSDEEIKKHDYVYQINLEKTNIQIIQCVSDFQVKIANEKNGSFTKLKIIAYQPKGNSPELDLPLLPEIVIEDDVEKKTNRKVCKCKRAYENPLSEICSLCWNELYPDEKDELKEDDLIESKAATKVYSEDDLRKAIQFGVDKCQYGLLHETKKKETMINNFIQSLKQPKTPKWFVAEMEEQKTATYGGILVKQLKTTTINGKPYLVGHYEFYPLYSHTEASSPVLYD
jgi:hypothetical protein